MSDAPKPNRRLEALIKTILASEDLNDLSPIAEKMQFRDLVLALTAELNKPDCEVPVKLFEMLDNRTRVMLMQTFCGIMVNIVTRSLHIKPSPNKKP